MDKRIIKTKSKLKSAYFKLLNLNPDINISVSYLCKNAKINRSTFYLHYSNIEEMYLDFYNDTFKEFENVTKNYIEGLTDFILNENANLDYFKNIFTLIRENYKIYNTIFKKEDITNINNKFTKYGKNLFIKFVGENYNSINNITSDYYYTYISSGFLSIINKWIDEEMNISDIDMAEMITQFLKNGNRMFIIKD